MLKKGMGQENEIDLNKRLLKSNPQLLKQILEDLKIKLIDEYLDSVKLIEKEKKTLGIRKFQKNRDHYIKRLLTPLWTLNKLHPLGENPYRKQDSTYPFVEEKIWIDREIDIKTSEHDKQKYSINLDSKLPWFDPDERNITIWIEYKEDMERKRKKDVEAKAKGIQFRPITPIGEGKTSLRELYQKRLPTFTEETLRSKDLLNRLLVCFTIKRALNGDNEARDKLFQLFKKAAVSFACKIACKRKLKSYIDDIKQDAEINLHLIISGYSPEFVIKALLEDKKINKWIVSFYFWYYSEYVPEEIDKIMKCQPRDERTKKERALLARRGFSKEAIDTLEIDYLLNPVSVIDAYTRWKGTPKRTMKFNNFVFQPNQTKETTYLQVWLFGTEKNRMQGKFCQMMSDSLKRYVAPESPHDFLDGGEESETKQEFNYRQKIIKDKKSGKRRVDDETIEEAVEKLIGNGISKRDAEIFLKHKLQGSYKTELAQMYALDRRQIYRICKNLSIKYPS